MCVFSENAILSSNMFRKPKRNFRSRRKESGSDDDANNDKNQDQESMDVEESFEPSISIPKKVKKKSKDKDKKIEKTPSVLSFEQYEEDHHGKSQELLTGRNFYVMFVS